MKSVNIHEAKTHLSRLLVRVQAGEEIIISKPGEPYAKLVPVSAPVTRQPGIAKGAVTDAFFEPLSADELLTIGVHVVIERAGPAAAASTGTRRA